MLARLLLLFLITPVVELALLIQLGDLIGFWPTVGIIVLTGVTGSYLAKREGLSVWSRFNERLQGAELPGKELLDGVIILISGALLITPGVLTDVVGFIGLIPFTRSQVRKYVNRRIQRAMERGSVRMTFGGFRPFAGGDLGRGGGAAGPQRGGHGPSGGEEYGRSAGDEYGSASGDSRAGGGDAGAGRRGTGSPGRASDSDWRGSPRDVPGHSRDG